MGKPGTKFAEERKGDSVTYKAVQSIISNEIGASTALHEVAEILGNFQTVANMVSVKWIFLAGSAPTLAINQILCVFYKSLTTSECVTMSEQGEELKRVEKARKEATMDQEQVAKYKRKFDHR